MGSVLLPPTPSLGPVLGLLPDNASNGLQFQGCPPIPPLLSLLGSAGWVLHLVATWTKDQHSGLQSQGDISSHSQSLPAGLPTAVQWHLSVLCSGGHVGYCL